MAAVEQLAARHQRAGTALRRRAQRDAAGLWQQVSTADLTGSWLPLVPRVVGLVTAAQVAAAREADQYTDAALRAQDIDPDAAGEVDPEAFAGVASDGRALDTLLMAPVFHAKTLIGRGYGEQRARQSGLAHLQLIVGTQVTDAGRTADGVALTARPQVSGYVRVLSLPSCPRCVVLAGRRYRWNAGFQRHPVCDCRHVPAGEGAADEMTTDPRRAIESGQVRGLSRAEHRAIVEDGADPAQVINARRGMYTAGGRRLTRESTSRRGVTRGGMRLRPEQIYRDATSRDDAIRLLRRFGYIR